MGPLMDKGALGWMHRKAIRDFWKVRHLFDEREDLIQEGHVCWWHIVNRYSFPASLTPDQQEYGRLMNLFKTTFTNRIRELAAKGKDPDYRIVTSRLRDLVSPTISDQHSELKIAEYILRQRQGDISDDSEVARAIVEASEPARTVLKFLVSDKMRRPYRLRADGTRETTNERLRRNSKGRARGDLRELARDYLLETIHQR